ncbi:TetR/AcrR family transcriptional regulator [Nocardioides jensenii]|uniref:TetR/AcrR family transcriptional regulator n=1 Tax=Nocardioides jensenii TaxID=1843 RepID=UPI00082EB178|nr:TetR/AcrR family transcriptional regulator [Nocardioides jensenii]
MVEQQLAHKRLDELQVNDIVAAARISRPTFYAHFDTKYSVVASEVAEMGAGVYALWAPLFESSGLIEPDVILECARATIAAWRERAALCIATTEGWHTSPEIHDAWNPVLLRFNSGLLDRLSRSGIEVPNPEGTAAALVAMFERCMYLTVAVPESSLYDQDEELAAVMARLWSLALTP